jgi:hypothetical protein
MEYWARGSASPAQPEVEKEKAPRGPSCKLQAASGKQDLTSSKLSGINRIIKEK